LLRYVQNFNNRIDEIVAAATNLRISFERAGASGYRPLLAVLYIVDPSSPSPSSQRSVSTFASRLQKMIKDQLLDGACVLIFDPENQRLVDLNEGLGFDQFAKVIGSGTGSTATRQPGDSNKAIDLGKLLSSGDVAGVVTGLASTSAGLSAVEAAVIASRREIIAKLQALAAAEDTTETIMHRAIANNYWIFGGQYVGIAQRRDFALLDQHDYPLLCADGSIQIVELKGPRASLARRYRNHFIVTNEVHEATSQCLNYLRSLDEQGPTLQATYHNEFGTDIDFRRARGTVVIGHLNHAEASSIAPFQVKQTLRSYNAHLSRIQVVTYSELLDSAERALQFGYLADKNTESS
jgi:Shedu protein SduA, C-terminal